MSQSTVTAGARAGAMIVHRVTSSAVLQCCDDMAEAVLLAASCAAPAVQIMAGLMSDKFLKSAPGTSPALCADINSMLFAMLLLSRMVSATDHGLMIDLSPDAAKAVLEDFARLMPLVKPDTFLRGDLLQTLNEPVPDSVVALTSGLLSKRPN